VVGVSGARCTAARPLLEVPATGADSRPDLCFPGSRVLASLTHQPLLAPLRTPKPQGEQMVRFLIPEKNELEEMRKGRFPPI